MQKRFLIPTVQDRIPELRKFLLSMQKYRKDWIFTIVAQKYSDADKVELEGLVDSVGIIADVLYLEEGVGPGRARRIGISTFDSDVWISLDDDMIAVPETNYGKVAEIILSRPDIGLLSSNWAKSRKQAEEKGVQEKLVKQNIVYTGGGLAFRRDFVKMFLKTTPDEPWLFDNVAWSLASYVAGYENYRYLGSVAIHKICTKGGRRSWVYQDSRTLPDNTLIRVRPASNNKRELEVGNCWHICDSSDLTEKAKQLHKEAKERMAHK